MKHTYKSACVLVAFALPLPVFATLITVALYIILGQQFSSPPGWLNWVSLLLGLGATIIAWLIASLFFRGATTAQYANRPSYDGIMQELRRLEINYDTIEPPMSDGTDEPDEIIGVVEFDEAVGAVQPVSTTQASESEQENDNAGALARAYDALYGEKDKVSRVSRIILHSTRYTVFPIMCRELFSRLSSASYPASSSAPCKRRHQRCRVRYRVLTLGSIIVLRSIRMPTYNFFAILKGESSYVPTSSFARGIAYHDAIGSQAPGLLASGGTGGGA